MKIRNLGTGEIVSIEEFAELSGCEILDLKTL